jgi:hypothetical protein
MFEISDLMLLNWVSFLAYPNLFGIKDFVVVVVWFFTKLIHNNNMHEGSNSMFLKNKFGIGSLTFIHNWSTDT